MTKSDLVTKLAKHYPRLVAKDAEIAVMAILDAIAMARKPGHDQGSKNAQQDLANERSNVVNHKCQKLHDAD